MSACRTTPVAPPDEVAAHNAYRQKISEYSGFEAWSLSGRLSIDDGEEGGSGRLTWQADGERADLEFRGALGKGAWKLKSEPGRVVLSRADGTTTVAASMEELVDIELGWQIPVDDLRWWVLGIAAPGEGGQVDLDEMGRLRSLQQHGWSVSFSRYRQFPDGEIPGRLDATRDNKRVKLAVGSWNRIKASDG